MDWVGHFKGLLLVINWDGSGPFKGMVSVEVPLDTLASDAALCDFFYGLPP